jgi:hypothetical protein
MQWNGHLQTCQLTNVAYPEKKVKELSEFVCPQTTVGVLQLL